MATDPLTPGAGHTQNRLAGDKHRNGQTETKETKIFISDYLLSQ